MSKAVEQVRVCLEEHGLSPNFLELEKPARTAVDAAREIGCELNQIVKSIVYSGLSSGKLYIFLTAGKNRIDPQLAEQIAGEPIGLATPTAVKRDTGFSIGGVPPIAHKSKTMTFIDCHLLQQTDVWAAAGTPNHVMCLAPELLVSVFGAVPSEFAE